MAIVSRLYPYELPLLAPLRLLRGTLTTRQGAIATLGFEGATLYGDLCPLPTIHRETLADASQQWQEVVVPALMASELLSPCPSYTDLAQPAFGLLPEMAELWPSLYPSVKFALESALLPHLVAQHPAFLRQPFTSAADFAQVFYGQAAGQAEHRVESRDKNAWQQKARKAYSAGLRLFKIKVGGQDWPEQKQAITALLNDCPGIRLRLDANHQLSKAQLSDPIVSSWPLEFIEDGPQDTSLYPTATDDGLWDAEPNENLLAGYQVLVLKPSRLQGLSGTWQWLKLAHSTGRRGHLSSCYESGVGLWAQLLLHQLAGEAFGKDTVLTPGFSPYLALKGDVLSSRLDLYRPLDLRLPLPIKAFALQPPQRCDLAAQRWLKALDHEGLCLADAKGPRQYGQLKTEVLRYARRLGGKSQVWTIEASDAFDVWVAALACLITGHKLLPLYAETPKAQLRRWEDLCQQLTGSGLRPWPPSATSDAGEEQPLPPIRDGAILIATSGSTGERKLAVLPASALYYSALGTNMFYGLTKDDRWGLCLPLFHVGGLMIPLRSTLVGGAVVPLPKRLAKAGPGAVTIISLVPAQLSDILSESGGNWAALKAIVVGGAATSAALQTEALSQKLPLSLTYGMTESCAQLVASRPATASLTAPEVLPFRQVKLASGLIAFAGPATFAGYFGQKARTPTEFIVSQDRGEWADDGSLRILGRADRQIIKGGENIPLAAAEQAVAALGVMSYAVAKDHPRLGQSYALVIAGPTQPQATEIEDILTAALPKFWLPDTVLWLPAHQVPGIKLSAALAKAALADPKSHYAQPLWPPSD